MKHFLTIFAALFLSQQLYAQVLHLKPRKADAMSGSEFANAIADTSLTLEARESLIFSEIKKGNVPNFLRKLKFIKDSATIDQKVYTINYYVLPDYLAIGSDENFFYVPMTSILAQKIADLTKANLPTRQMVNRIYQNAAIKLEPQPIPPNKLMTTVPVFIKHNELVNAQLTPYFSEHQNSSLTAGHKKDIVISNKIYGEKSNRVVIYGWHKLDGKPIQPLYNKHVNTWADYSHGVRLIQNKVWVNGKKMKVAKVLADPKLNVLLSGEGVNSKPFYPITGY